MFADNPHTNRSRTHTLTQTQDNVRAAWSVIWDLARSPRGRHALKQAFNICDEFVDEEDVWGLAYWIQSKCVYL